jgi:glutamate-1-semialdehyde 2,1-aminomutase
LIVFFFTSMIKSLKRSNELKNKARKIIPHQTGTFSRGASSFVEGVYPVYVQNANGSHFTDVDGNEYLDYLCGLGPITLGYNYPSVNEAIIEQLNNGILFSLPHPLEIELSEIMCKVIPNSEMVKFEKSGSNAVTGAVRAARAITKRDKIAYCGLGGVWHDWQAAMTSRDGGVPKFNHDLLRIFDYNDIEGLEEIFSQNPDQIAAIVMEPTSLEEPKNNFLKKVRTLANKENSILILDEVVTGFRFDLGGAQKYFDIDGDLVCFGKGMGNGLPISAITGKEEFMKIFNELWVSSTNNSETLSLAGSTAVINEMQNKDTITYCWELGKKLFDGWNKISNSYNLEINMTGYHIRQTMECYDSKKNVSRELEALVLQEMVKRGIFMSPGATFFSYSHTQEDIDYTLKSFDEVCNFISKNISNDNYLQFLEGTIPQEIWNLKISSTKKL